MNFIKICLLSIVLVQAADEKPTNDVPGTAATDIAFLNNYIAVEDPQRDQLVESINEANSVFQRGDASTALDKLSALTREAGQLPPARIMLAHFCFGQGNADLGKRILETAVLEHAEDPEGWMMLADLSVRQSALAAADLLFDQAWEKLPSIVETPIRHRYIQRNCLAGKSMVAQMRHQDEDAIRLLKAWIEVDPENLRPFERLANIHFKAGDSEAALEAFASMRELDSRLPVAEAALALETAYGGDVDGAKALWDKAEEQFADDVATMSAGVKLFLMIGDVRRARELFNTLLTLEDSTPNIAMLGGNVLLSEGRLDNAKGAFLKLTAELPQWFEPSNELALLMLRSEVQANLQRGIAMAKWNLNRVANSNADVKTAAAMTMALAHVASDDLSAATALAKQTLSSNTVQPRIAYFAAKVFLEAGEREIAKDLLQNTLSSHLAFPEKPQAITLLEKLSDGTDGLAK